MSNHYLLALAMLVRALRAFILLREAPVESINLILLDDGHIFFIPRHHFSVFFSVFNPDAIRDVKSIQKGNPSRYGGRVFVLGRFFKK